MSNQNPYPSAFGPSASDPSASARQFPHQAPDPWSPREDAPSSGVPQPPITRNRGAWEANPTAPSVGGQGGPNGQARHTQASTMGSYYPYPGASPTGAPREPKKESKGHFWLWVILSTLGILIAMFVYMIGESFTVGPEVLQWTLIKSGVLLIAALGCIALGAVVHRRMRASRAQGNENDALSRQPGLVLVGFVGLLLGYFALSNGVPAALDLADGPQPFTVTSCTYDQYSMKKSSSRGGSTTVYENEFTMTFDDGTVHTTTIEMDSAEEIEHEGGAVRVLYQACHLRSGAASMTVDYYTRTWVIADARLNN